MASVEALADASCIDEPNNEGDTPLHLAAWNNQFAVVRRLVESGATVLSFNKDGHTPADLAMEKGHTAIKEFLDEQVPGVGLSLSC